MENQQLVNENARQIASLVAEIKSLRNEIERIAVCYTDLDDRVTKIERVDSGVAAVNNLKWKLLAAAGTIVGIIGILYGMSGQ